jgi:hypothetical protein
MSDWIGPVELLFKSFSDHNSVFQYRTDLNNRAFQFYVPKYMFPHNVYPESLLVSFEKKEGPNTKIGFNSDTNSSTPIWSGPKNTEVFRYVTGHQKVNSELYDVTRNGRDYKLYVPNTFFGNLEAPSYLLVKIYPQT